MVPCLARRKEGEDESICPLAESSRVKAVVLPCKDCSLPIARIAVCIYKDWSPPQYKDWSLPDTRIKDRIYPLPDFFMAD